MTKRRGRDEGSIYQRTDGLWCSSVSLGLGPDNKRKRKVVYGKSIAEVRTKLKKLNRDKDDGVLCATGGITLAKFLPEFIKYHAQNLRPNTLREYNKTINNYLIPLMGSKKIDEIRVGDVYDLHTAIEKPGMRKHAHSVLSVALTYAAKREMILGNPCMIAKPPKMPTPKRTTASKEEVERIFAASLGTKYHALFVVAVTTGMRQGEIFGLQWKHINLDNGTIMIEQSMAESNGKLSLGDPKNYKSRRRIDLSKGCVSALQKHKEIIPKNKQSKSELIFTSPNGFPFRKSNFQRNVWKPLLEKAEVPYMKFHSLRHTMATLLLAENVNPKVVQERMGHSSIQMTLDTYSHAIPTLQKEAASKMDDLFG